MRTYPVREILEGGTLRADDLNAEYRSIAGTLNGGIDSTMHPSANIVQTKFKQRNLVTDYEGVTSSYGVTASYHQSAKWTTDATTPNAVIEPEVDVQRADWRALRLEMAGSDQTGTVLEWISREGMITGAAMIDYERRLSYTELDPGGGGSPTYIDHGRDNWVEFGVFLGDLLIADTGKLYCGRRTIELPFASPAPSGYARLEVRYRAWTQYQVEHGYTEGGTTYYYPVTDALRYPPVNVYSTHIWAQNRYR